ncbi:hypothetical protein JW992_14320 [candidate division KSB1 bacterium]|nr:hypothetical protein [candidate division KSB1 bacterium]
MPESKSAFQVMRILTTLLLTLTVESIQANTLQETEKAARLTAIRLFDALKAIEAYLETPPQEQTRAPNLKLKPGADEQVAAVLDRNKPALALLERLVVAAENDFKRRYGDIEPGRDDVQGQADLRSLYRIRKYGNAARSTFDSYAALIGATPPLPVQPGKSGPLVRGTIRAGMGSNTATTEIKGGDKSETSVTRSDLAVDLTADLTPQDKLVLRASRREEIRFAPLSQIRGDLDYTRRLSPQGALGGRVGFDQYQNDANDSTDVNRTAFGIRGVLTPSPGLRANADFTLTTAAYPNNTPLDYKESRLNLNAAGEVSPKAAWGVEYSRASQDLEDNTGVADHSRDQIAGTVTLRTGERSTLAVNARSDGFAFDTSSPRSYRRQTLELKGRSRSGIGRSSTWALSFRSKDYEAIQERNYREYRGDLQTRSGLGTNQERSSQFFLNYRSFEGKENPAYLDYLETRWDLRRASSMLFWESNLYVLYFFKDGSTERNSRISQFLWCGILLAANQGIVVGPYVATDTDLVTVSGSNVGPFESRANRVRYGVKGNVRLYKQPLSIDGQARYEVAQTYNIPDSPAPVRLEIQVNASYAVTPVVDATLRLQNYSIGADDPGAIQTSEFDVLVGLAYHLGRSQ